MQECMQKYPDLYPQEEEKPADGSEEMAVSEAIATKEERGEATKAMVKLLIEGIPLWLPQSQIVNALKQKRESKIVLEALVEENMPNYFLRHNIRTGSWANAMLNSELVSLLRPHLDHSLERQEVQLES
eukprot:bmy_11886T0